jgi:aminopeptidase N
MSDRRFKYRREDFGELPVKLNHLRIYLNFLEGYVEVTNCLEMTAKERLDVIQLDARELKIIRVDWAGVAHGDVSEEEPPAYEYDREMSKLIIKLPRAVQPGEGVCMRTITHCLPSDHILEGIYKDATPPGAPQQYMSQCQQWGFQRIMPILDDCRAKCTMTTTIEADRAYTHLISNGDISRVLNPEGKPVIKPGDPDRQIITFENTIPMAPYLFLACVGTWDTLVDHVTYELGRTVRLEYLVPPGSLDGVRIPMEILKQAIPWVRKTQDYEYTGECYRTICMNKSNFGGMENTGNTTIVTDAALVDEHSLDLSILYAHAVIVHEFEHNQCGSETTMESPFDVWLNEAYTVDVERRFMADLFDPSFIRLHQVDSIRHPLLGPLAIEDGGHAGRIVREGFNDPDELIDGVTYVKAAEVVRMLRLILGSESFTAGKALYFSRYRNGNANTDQFFECFEEVSGCSLEQFKKVWLYTVGYPKVIATTAYEPVKREYRIRFRQDLGPGQVPFHLPIALGLVDQAGQDIQGAQTVFNLKEQESELVFDNIAEPPAFASLNRDYSFYGTLRHENVGFDELMLQAHKDPNAVNRVDAMRKLTDLQRIKILHDPDAEPDTRWLVLYGEILGERTMPAALKAYFLRIEEQPLDREYCTWHQELVVAREKLMLAVNRLYRPKLREQFEELDTYSSSPLESPRSGIEARMLKQVLLDLITVDDSADSHRLILDHYRNATSCTDRVAALMALNRGSAPWRRTLLQEVYEDWHAHLSGYANYLRVVASGTNDDVFDTIAVEKLRPTFDITQPTWCRALFLPMATNSKMVWTDKGIAWIADTVIELSTINATTASRLMNTFQQVRKLKSPLKEKVNSALEKVAAEVSEEMSPIIHGQVNAYLQGP